MENILEHFDKKYHAMLCDALKFLDQREPIWGLDEPIDRLEYCKGLIERVAK